MAERNAKSKLLLKKSNRAKVMRVILMLISLIVVGGCVASQHSVVADVEVAAWSNPKYVVMDNSDTTTLRDVKLFVRYSPLLVDDSLTLAINIMSPDSMTYSEEVTLYFDKSASERSASRNEVFSYRNNVVWRKEGDYRFEITPIAPIQGVEAIGVNIIKSMQ